MSVPLVVAAAATSVGAPAYAAGSRHEKAARAGTRTVHQRILRRGSTGPDVVRLQRSLGVAADGMFGSVTEGAVRRFQRAHRLLVDGEVGPQTWGAIHVELRGRAGELVLRLHDRGPAVAAVQRALGVAADGDFGPITLAAVRAFQERHGLAVDGQVGPITSAALGVVLRGPVSRDAQPATPSHTQAPLGERAAHLALHYLGVPYRWGGSTPSGFDCSGLVYYVYGRLGVRLPRVTYSQWDAGRHVDRADLEAGDLVFFDGLGHVGIYLGGGRFVHAPHTGEAVEVSSLTGWYAGAYVGAVRV